MMKIMIVDDEVIIRTGLATVIKWDELGLTFLEPAASAEEAMERIPVEQPDILLTDIRMTGKTGLQLAEEAREILPSLDIIILTGYDDFSYTQQAIRQGINDYLLKTSRPDDIIRTVLRAKQRLEEKSHQHNQEQLARRNHLLEKWIIHGEPIQEQNELEELQLLNPDSQAQQILGYQVWMITGSGWNESPKKEKLLSFAIENICRELLQCETFIQQERVIVLMPVPHMQDERERELKLRRNEQAVMKIKSMLRCQLNVTIGQLVHDKVHLHDSYQSALHIEPYHRLINDSIIRYDDMLLRAGAPTTCTAGHEHQLITILLEDDPLSLKTWVNDYIQQHLAHPQFTLDSLEAAMQHVVTIVNQWLTRAQQAIDRASLYPLSILFRYSREMEPSVCLFQYIHSVMKMYHHQLASSTISHVQKAKSFIESNAELDLNLQQVANRIHIHPSHLSELFKKETGMTFSDYITQQRMKRAAQLLSTTRLKVGEIANHVGYTDVKYFSQLFKKDTGITPSEYREMTYQ
ncbi:helix-turn-helix domain-containing protein [Paenibacillus sp. FSL W7-1287]|uniref:helix-turn-helix domain-containing protein n=1 Tax=Paenibacillus sp. FSL W7-1287 TaxID=2954538 RepID=UPI0030FA89CA